MRAEKRQAWSPTGTPKMLTRKEKPPYHFEKITKTVYTREKINGKYSFVSIGKISEVSEKHHENWSQVDVYISIWRHWRFDKMKWCPDCEASWRDEEE